MDGFPQFQFNPDTASFQSIYPTPGLPQTPPAEQFAKSAVGDAMRKPPVDRRAMIQLLGALAPQLLDASQNGGVSAASPVASLAAINPLAAGQFIKPGPIPRAIVPRVP